MKMTKLQWGALAWGACFSFAAWMRGEPFGFGHGLWGWASWGWAVFALPLASRLLPAVQGRAKPMFAAEGELSFFCPQFEFKVDEERKTGRLVSVDAQILGAGRKSKRGRVDLERPLAGWSMSTNALHRHEFSSVGGVAIVDGRPVPVQLGVDSKLVPTGEFDVSLFWGEKDFNVVDAGGLHQGKWSPGHRVQARGKGERIVVSLRRVGEPNAEDFRRFWKKVEAKIQELVHEPLIESHRRAEGERMEERRLAEDAARASDRAEVCSRLAKLGADASSSDGYLAWGMRPEGGVEWAVHVSRDGRAALIGDGGSWSGSLSEASAKASIAELPARVAGQRSRPAVVVELRDEEHERRHLAKRRIAILVWRPREQMVEWVDRIEILSRLAPVGDDARAPSAKQAVACGR